MIRFPSPKIVIVALAICSSSTSFIIKEPNTNKLISEDSDFIDLNTFDSNAFIEPDIKTTGELVAKLTEDSNQNPEELGAYFEGDILMPFLLDTKNGLVEKSSRWPKEVVPYEIAGNFTVDQLAILDWAFGEYHNKTCIRFKPRSTEKDYVSILNTNSGCWSAVGRWGGKQLLNLQTPACMKRGVVLHELMHSLGFMHEHNRHDRDTYITVHTKNIMENRKNSFQKLSKNKANGMGLGYDYTSVMHYSQKAFSKNGQPTIESKKDIGKGNKMGQRFGFSVGDVAKINLMYKCCSRDLMREEENVK